MTYRPSDEQIDALADVFAQYAVVSNPTGLSVGIDSAYEVAEALAGSPALRSIVRAAQVQTLREVADDAVDYVLWTENHFLPGPNSDAAIEYHQRLAEEMRERADELEAS